MSRALPMHEGDTSPPFGEYGVQKAAMATCWPRRHRGGGLVTTVAQPGHLSGPGWMTIDPLRNLDPGVWRTLSAGEEVAVPGSASELVHQVHADDVARVFDLAIEHRDAAAGEAFIAVAPQRRPSAVSRRSPRAVRPADAHPVGELTRVAHRYRRRVRRRRLGEPA